MQPAPKWLRLQRLRAWLPKRPPPNDDSSDGYQIEADAGRRGGGKESAQAALNAAKCGIRAALWDRDGDEEGSCG